MSSETGNAVVYRCHAGLNDFAVPIIVSGKHLGGIYGGQVITEPLEEEKIRNIAREYGIDEEVSANLQQLMDLSQNLREIEKIK